MSYLDDAIKAEDELIRIRRKIHENPELSGYELETLQLIKERLTQLNIPYTEVEFGGILGRIENGTSEKTVLLRADIDALPLTENPKNLLREKAVVSKNEGVAHACGHDAHTAMLLTAAKILKDNISDFDGNVILCFERAEENRGPEQKYGALPLLAYLAAEHIRIDSSFALHVDPNVEAGIIAVSPGPVMAGALGFRVTLTGTGGHGSRPDVANNPLEGFISIYHALTEFRLKHISPFQPFTFSIPQIESGAQGNIIEKDLTFTGSARFFSEDVGILFDTELTNIVENVSKVYHLESKIDRVGPLPPVVNGVESSEIARTAIKSRIGESHLADIEPMMGSESFLFYIKQYTGAMARIGVKNDAYGSGADLHDPQFDIDESALKYGAAALAAYAVETLSDNRKEVLK